VKYAALIRGRQLRTWHYRHFRNLHPYQIRDIPAVHKKLPWQWIAIITIKVPLVRNGLLVRIYMQCSFLHSWGDGPWIERRGQILRTIVWSSYTPVNRPAYVMYRCQDSGQTHNIITANNSWENLEKLKNLRKTLTNENCVHGKGNVCYNSAENFWSSHLLSKHVHSNIQNEIFNWKFSCRFVSVWNRIVLP
jgi:hypothetical protein